MTLDPEPSRAYTALSYVWGDASVTEDIIVNGVSFAVTSNLASALRQIRKVFGEVLLWADAICTYLGDTT
jgi:Heterokaryon incompatibility protein (HET)